MKHSPMFATDGVLKGQALTRTVLSPLILVRVD